MAFKIQVALICVTGGVLTEEYAARFVGSWLAFPPGLECELTVCCNGGPLPMTTALLFMPLAAAFLPRINDAGKDMSAYQQIAATTDADILVCFGESVYFHQSGWLKRIVDSWEQHGPGMYGFFSSNLVRSHMNTTAFAICPKLFRSYPPIRTNPERYEAEHGLNAIWRRFRTNGKPTWFVTWHGCWEPRLWRTPANILWRGDQSELLIWCNHVDRYRAAPEETKRLWERGANSPFK